MALPHTIVSERDDAEMVLVPAGDFHYGITQARVAELLAICKEEPDPRFKTEASPRFVTLRNCYIDKYPVTNGRYAAFVKATGHAATALAADPRWNKPNHPVVGVSFRDAVAYAEWARKRLPTEEEWERAARGTDGRAWPWGDEFDPKRCNCSTWHTDTPTDVTRFPDGISPVGAFDMAGNVWELTTGNWENFGKTIRGGSYQSGPAYCRTTARWGIDPDIKGANSVGFRCVMELTKARIYARARM